MQDLRDEILAATIEAITKAQHVYVTTDKILVIVERALAEQREGILALQVERLREAEAYQKGDAWWSGLTHGICGAMADTRNYGQEDEQESVDYLPGMWEPADFSGGWADTEGNS